MCAICNVDEKKFIIIGIGWEFVFFFFACKIQTLKYMGGEDLVSKSCVPIKRNNTEV